MGELSDRVDGVFDVFKLSLDRGLPVHVPRIIYRAVEMVWGVDQ